MTSMASSIQPKPPAMSDLRSAGETSLGQKKPKVEGEDELPLELESLVLIGLGDSILGPVAQSFFIKLQNHRGHFQCGLTQRYRRVNSAAS